MSYFAKTALDNPTDDTTLSVWADCLEDQCDHRATLVRWWTQNQSGLIDLFLNGPEPEKPFCQLGKRLMRMPSTPRRLLLITGWRAVQRKWPVAWEKITTWPGGITSASVKHDLLTTVRKIELVALGLMPKSELKAAWNVGGAARNLARAALNSAGAAQDSAGAAQDSARAAWNSAGAAQDSAGAAQDSARAAWNLAGAIENVARAALNSAGAAQDSAGAAQDLAAATWNSVLNSFARLILWPGWRIYFGNSWNYSGD